MKTATKKDVKEIGEILAVKETAKASNAKQRKELASIKQEVRTILNTHGLNFKIHKIQDKVDFNGETLLSPYYSLINGRTKEILNCVGEGYRVSQNNEIVEMIVRGIKPFGDKLTVTKAGSLGGGRKVFIQLLIEGDAKVGKDTIKRYVTIIDSNDGSTSLSVGIGDLTMSCQNQFYRFYKAGQHKFRHTVSLDKKILEIPNLVEIALAESMKQIKIYKQFASTPASKALVNQMVTHLLGHDRNTDPDDLSPKALSHMNKLYSNIELEMADKGMNVWGLHSGVTRWTTHEKNAPNREGGRLESLLSSTNYRTNMESFEFAMKLSGIEMELV